MCADLFLLIGTLSLAALNNSTLRIKTSPRRSNPSPRLFTLNQYTPYQAANQQKHYPVYPQATARSQLPPYKNVPPQKGRHANF